VSPDPFDRLARAAAEADDLSLTRRTAVKLAAVALVTTAPFGARTAAAAAPPAGAAQVPNQACLDCRERVAQAYRRNRQRCFTFPRILVLQWCAFETEARRFIDAAKEGCYHGCQPLSQPPTPVPQEPITPQPQEPITPQPTPPVSDECLNCMKVGGKCCPSNGPLCVCANPDYPCSRYGCAGD
jgi:hypothetical protein